MKKIRIIKDNNCIRRYTVNDKEYTSEELLEGVKISGEIINLGIEQSNIVDIFRKKTILYRVLVGFIIVMMEGIGGEFVDEEIYELGYKRKLYSVKVLYSQVSSGNIKIKMIRKSIFSNYNLKFEIDDQEINQVNEKIIKDREDKMIWYQIFILPIIIAIISVILLLKGLEVFL